MKHIFRTCVATAACLSLLSTPVLALAAAPEDIVSDQPMASTWSMTSDPSLGNGISLQFRLKNVTLHTFQDKDAGTVELLSVMADPANRRYVYLSARINHHEKADSEGPFTSKIYRYDLDTAKLVRIYRDYEPDAASAWGGYILLGFNKNKLMVTRAAANDNSPGPCWEDSALASGDPISYLDAKKPWEGIKKFTPSGSFLSLRKKALQMCEGSL